MQDDLRTPREGLRRQTRALRGGGRLAYCERLAGRLDVLLDALEEEGETWTEGSSGSLREMLSFLEAVPDFQCPTGRSGSWSSPLIGTIPIAYSV